MGKWGHGKRARECQETTRENHYKRKTVSHRDSKAFSEGLDIRFCFRSEKEIQYLDKEE